MLFADLVGSTALADAAADPESTRAMLERFYAAMAEEVERAGGTVEKFVGDAVMAAFGAPVALEDHAERALHAALAMRRRLAALFDERVGLRVGVNSGEVVVGRAWAGGSFVSGDAVNVAARLEQAAAAGQILVGERAAALVRGAFEFGERQSVVAKGKPEPLVALPLLRSLSLMRPRAAGGLARAFVGREPDLVRLLEAYRQTVSSGRPAVVVVVGEAGVGKTRLLRELWERLAHEQAVPLRRVGRCLPYGEGVTYWPLGEVLREHVGVGDDLPAEQVLAQLPGREILGRALGLDVAPELHPLLARELFRDSWVGFFEEALEQGPVVVLIEDIHWAEEPLLELLDLLVRDVRGPLLLLLTGRPEVVEERLPLGGGRVDSSVVRLEPLPPSRTQELVSVALGSDLPRELLDRIVSRSEGNPFFVEEMLENLIDRGVLERAEHGWAARALEGSDTLPDSIQAVVAARIDLLGTAEKTALQTAAVIGRTFWTRPLSELLDGLQPDLRVLEDRDFIRRRPGSSRPDDVEYVIKHTLTRETAYSTLPKARRAQLHARVAEWLEREAGGREEDAALLAHHYYEAVRPDDANLAWAEDPARRVAVQARAVHVLRHAAELALRRYEIDEAIILLERALALEPDPDRQAGLWRRIAEANLLGYNGAAFTAAVERALELTENRDDQAEAYALLAFALVSRPAMWGSRPEPDVADAWVTRLLELAQPKSANRVMGLVARSFSTSDEAAAVEATAIAEELGDVELRSLAWYARSWAAAGAARLLEACRWQQQRLQLLDQIHDPDHQSLVYMDGIWAAVATGSFDDARRLAVDHERCVAPLTPHHHLHAAASSVWVEAMADDWERVRRLKTRVERAVAANPSPCGWNPVALSICALAEARLGDDEEAARLEAAAAAVAGHGVTALTTPYAIWLHLARNALADIEPLLVPTAAAATHNTLASLQVLELPLARLDALVALERWSELEQEARPLLITGTYIEPFAQRALGAARADTILLEAATERFLALGLRWQAARTRELAISRSAP